MIGPIDSPHGEGLIDSRESAPRSTESSKVASLAKEKIQEGCSAFLKLSVFALGALFAFSVGHAHEVAEISNESLVEIFETHGHEDDHSGPLDAAHFLSKNGTSKSKRRKS